MKNQEWKDRLRIEHDTRDETSAYSILEQSQAEHAAPSGEAHPNHTHAWRGTWDRPVKIDEKTQHPFTIARMTDHNVKGTDE